MEWERAKNILIAVLIVLNVFLYALNIADAQKYRVSEEDIGLAREIMENNGISLPQELPLEHKPMRLAVVNSPAFEFDDLKDRLFEDTASITRTNSKDKDKVVYQNDTCTLTLSAGGKEELANHLQYECKGSEATKGMQNEELAVFAKNLLGTQYIPFVLAQSVTKGNQGIYLFNEVIDGKQLFASYVKVTVTEGEGFLLEAQKYNLASYGERSHRIFRVDEILLSFLHSLEDESGGKIEPVTISRIDLGYDTDDTLLGQEHRAKPYYRIFIKGREMPIFVDALTNDVKKM